MGKVPRRGGRRARAGLGQRRSANLLKGDERGADVWEDHCDELVAGEDDGVVEGLASAADGAEIAHCDHGQQAIVCVCGDLGGCEGVDKGDDGVHHKEEEADETAAKCAGPEEAPQDTVVLLEDLVDAMCSCDVSEKVLHPHPATRESGLRCDILP